MALAVSEPVAEYISNSDASSYTHSSSYTPTANSLQVIFVGATGTVAASPTLTGGSGWTTAPTLQATKGSWNAGANTIYCFVGLAGASPGSFTAVFDCTGDAATGCTMSFFEITGAATSSYVVQMAAINSVVGANPTFTFGSNLNTNNCYLAAICTTTNPANVTEPSGWATERVDSGHTSPTTGIWAGYRVNGESGTTITATKASSTHGGLAIEIAAASGATYTLTGQTGALTLTGNNGVLKASRVLTGNTGALVLTGNTGALTLTRRITGQTGALVLTGNNGTLKASRVLTGNTGALTLTGNTGTLKASRVLTGQTGALTLTGNTGTLTAGRVLTGQTGELVLTGNDATLTYTSVGGPTYTLTGLTGALTLTAGQATLTYTSASPPLRGRRPKKWKEIWPEPPRPEAEPTRNESQESENIDLWKLLDEILPDSPTELKHQLLGAIDSSLEGIDNSISAIKRLLEEKALAEDRREKRRKKRLLALLERKARETAEDDEFLFHIL